MIYDVEFVETPPEVLALISRNIAAGKYDNPTFDREQSMNTQLLKDAKFYLAGTLLVGIAIGAALAQMV